MINVVKNGKHVVVRLVPDGPDAFASVPVKVTLAESEARDFAEKLACACGAKAVASRRAVAAAEKVLADNGIEEDEAPTVLQAVGYALAGIELYPVNYTERRLVEVEPVGRNA